MIVAETIGDALDDLDAVVDAFNEIGAKRVFAVRQEAWEIGF